MYMTASSCYLIYEARSALLGFIDRGPEAQQKDALDPEPAQPHPPRVTEEGGRQLRGYERELAACLKLCLLINLTRLSFHLLQGMNPI